MVYMPVRYLIHGSGAEEISASVEEALSRGDLTPGAALPAIRELAPRLGVNPNTVAAAYRLLRDRGIVETAGRRGTRVRQRPASTPRSLRGLAVPKGVRDLSTGNPDPKLLPIATVQLTVTADRRRTPLLYGQPALSPGFAAQVRDTLAADGVPAEHLTAVSGTMDGIERVFAAHLRPGDRVAVEDPGWPNLLDLLGALSLSPEPVGVDDDGAIDADLVRALRRGARALVVTSRAQNPTGAAISEQRAAMLRRTLAEHAERVLLVEDDYCAGIAGAQLHTLAGATTHWAYLRSTGKSYGPDLRLATLTGDSRTIERVHARLQLGLGWVSHLIQDLAVSLWQDTTATRLVEEARTIYARNRTQLRAALADRGLAASAQTGINVWIPVPDETVAITRLLNTGWAAAPGSRFRTSSPPAIRVTIADLERTEISPLADAITDAVTTADRAGV